MEYNTIFFGDVAKIKNGYAFKSKEFQEKGIPVIKIKNIISPIVDTKDSQKVSIKTYEKTKGFSLKKNDILISLTGSGVNQMSSAVGKVGRIEFDYPALQNQRVGKFELKYSNSADLDFLFYYFLQPKITEYLVRNSTGSANQANINSKLIETVKIPNFSLIKQKSISKFLNQITRKIETNQKMIANLKELSQTLFKHWFVDFEFPDEDGNPYKSSGGEMIDSELGKIPSNWKIYKLKDIASHKKETFNPKKSEEVTVKHFSLPAYDNEEQAIEEEVNKIKSNKWIINNNCVLFSKMNPDTKRIWLPVIDNKKLNVASSEFVVMESPNNKINSFIYNICLNSQFIDYLKANTTGSTNSRQRVKPTIAVNYKLAIEDSIVKKYSEIITPYMEEMKILRSEIGKLTQLRDTLLPKLMSGELEISDDIEVNSDELSI
ncbi:MULTISPECIES: restriction endonuclease subunit S [Staphylococcus]|uniref:Restriction endonuclease subunit S n=9 Tax=Staphylococcus TaxID=1279 RepID=A0ABY2KVN6_9STAP|nr:MULTISPECIES: restriction endonuclease subunit S [Staphylococcus]HDH6209166.1 restriction endonuclease subunit S [Staphylococcus aureus LTCF-14-59]AEV42169.1 HsdS [Staphylococcus aureus]AEV77157.1 restriction endonuclease subunit S [Staphylococcus aureus subsp. aureus M013]AFI61398.1 type I restriction modification system specificity subunit [Staphylococcus aureus]AGW32556.1 type I restriction-modification system, specificity subunit S [Staphylococcus aureus subsp. aureus SA957]